MKTEKTPPTPRYVLTALALAIIFVICVRTCGNKEPRSDKEQTDANKERWTQDSLQQEDKKKKDSLIDAEIRRPKTKEEIRIYKTRAKYDCSLYEAQAILKHQVCNGMTKQMCIGAWGKPESINTTRVNDIVTEQWVYGFSYLYFNRDGRLYASQTSQ